MGSRTSDDSLQALFPRTALANVIGRISPIIRSYHIGPGFHRSEIVSVNTVDRQSLRKACILQEGFLLPLSKAIFP